MNLINSYVTTILIYDSCTYSIKFTPSSVSFITQFLTICKTINFCSPPYKTITDIATRLTIWYLAMPTFFLTIMMMMFSFQQILCSVNEITLTMLPNAGPNGVWPLVDKLWLRKTEWIPKHEYQLSRISTTNINIDKQMRSSHTQSMLSYS